MSRRARLAAQLAFAAALGAGPPGLAQGAPPPPSAREVATAAVQSDAYEIAAAQDASAQSRDPRVRAFAQQMIEDHRRLDAAMRQAAAAAGLPPPPPGMSGDGAKMLAGVQGQTGAAFDRAYIDQQVLTHEQAMVVVGGFARGGEAGPVRDAAQSATPVIAHHLQMARALKDQLGGAGG